MVRDVWREAPVSRRDLDLVVEGDGPAVARRLAQELGGTLREHERFLTASVETPGAGRIDVATARTERYETRGALPRVMPAAIEEDLRRRDFSVNAMAIELASGAWGLLDPFGGREDLARRRLRVLHPLAYVEDPTRLFRAARHGARLGLTPDRATLAAQALPRRAPGAGAAPRGDDGTERAGARAPGACTARARVAPPDRWRRRAPGARLVSRPPAEPRLARRRRPSGARRPAGARGGAPAR